MPKIVEKLVTRSAGFRSPALPVLFLAINRTIRKSAPREKGKIAKELIERELV